MLQITIPDRPAIELWDDETETFIDIPPVKGQTLQLEHSLVSLSKWESKWHKAFFSKKEKTDEEILDYIKCMTLTQNVRPEVYEIITEENTATIKEYIEDPMTATTFSNEPKGGGSRESITSELVYYWMIALNIPFECQKWHLNRLLTLIKVCNIKNGPAKKMSKTELKNRNRALNEARKKQLNTTG